jgi:hypothetical protein
VRREIATLQSPTGRRHGHPLRGRARSPGRRGAARRDVERVLATGYDGCAEVEVLSDEVWARPRTDARIAPHRRKP